MSILEALGLLRHDVPTPAKPPRGYTPAAGLELSEKHVNRYGGMLYRAERDGASAHVDAPECRNLIAIWEQVAHVGGVWERIERAGRFEIIDAYEDEE